MALIIYVLPACAGERSFSNSDLDKYKGEDNSIIIPKIEPAPPAKHQKASRKSDDEKSKQYWCSKGSSAKAKVQKAKDKVDDAHQRLANIYDERGKKKGRADAERKVRAAKKDLYRAEQDLNDLEQSAHRQNVPPGWLRCQFSY